MGFRPRLSLVVSGLCMGLLSMGLANATTVSHSGTLTADDQSQLFTYTVAQDSTVVFATDSYGTGGFVPVLSLFDSTGMVIASDGGGATCHAGMSKDATTNICDDAYLMEALKAGSYTLAVTEFFNVPVGPNLSNGFLMQGQGNFTGATCGTTGAFYQTDIAPCVQRTGNFSLTATATATPEPSTLWLAVLPLMLFGLARRRRSSFQN